MRRALIISLSVGIGALAALIVWQKGVWYRSSPSPTSAPYQARTDSPTPNSLTPPASLSIPRLGIQSTVEQVGLDSQKRMDVPKNDTDVAWYNLGFKPGEKGNAVIDGHFDTVTGAPAVFYYLSNLEKGDSVVVTDAKGTPYTFEVVDKRYFDFDKLPLEQIFGSSNAANLNLITCEGVWNPTTHNYSQRLVVYTTLEKKG